MQNTAVQQATKRHPKNTSLPEVKLVLFFHEFDTQRNKPYSVHRKADYSQLNGGRCNPQNAVHAGLTWAIGDVIKFIDPTGAKAHFHDHATPKKFMIYVNGNECFRFPEFDNMTITTADNNQEKRNNSLKEVLRIKHFLQKVKRLPQNTTELQKYCQMTDIEKYRSKHVNDFRAFLKNKMRLLNENYRKVYVELFEEQVDVMMAKTEVYDHFIRETQRLKGAYDKEQNHYKFEVDALKDEYQDEFPILAEIQFAFYNFHQEKITLKCTKKVYESIENDDELLATMGRHFTKVIQYQLIPEPKLPVKTAEKPEAQQPKKQDVDKLAQKLASGLAQKRVKSTTKDKWESCMEILLLTNPECEKYLKRLKFKSVKNGTITFEVADDGYEFDCDNQELKNVIIKNTSSLLGVNDVFFEQIPF